MNSLQSNAAIERIALSRLHNVKSASHVKR